MNKMLSIFFSCLLFSSIVNANNIFFCQGDGYELSFATSSFVGVPTLSMKHNNNTTNCFEVEINKTENEVFFSGKTEHGQISFTAPENRSEFTMTASIGCTYVELTCSGATVYF